MLLYRSKLFTNYNNFMGANELKFMYNKYVLNLSIIKQL